MNSRAYLIRLGQRLYGIVGAGWTRTEPHEELAVDIEFELLSETPLIPMATLPSRSQNQATPRYTTGLSSRFRPFVRD